MPTLLLSRSCQPEADQFTKIVQTQKWHHQWIAKDKMPGRLHGRDFAIYAETDLALRVAQTHNLALIEPSFQLLATIPPRYTRREIRFCTLQEARDITKPSFLKPADCNAKLFDPAVFEPNRIRLSSNIPLETPILISEPVAWEVEYRVIVMDRTVVTFSPYIRGGWLARNENDEWPCPHDETTELLEFCDRFLSDTSITVPPAFTLDVGKISGQGWAIVEFNPVWCSGFLGCDLALVFPVLDRVCQQGHRLSLTDAVWTRTAFKRTGRSATSSD